MENLIEIEQMKIDFFKMFDEAIKNNLSLGREFKTIFIILEVGWFGMGILTEEDKKNKANPDQSLRKFKLVWQEIFPNKIEECFADFVSQKKYKEFYLYLEYVVLPDLLQIEFCAPNIY